MKTVLVSFYSDIGESNYYSDHSKRLIKNCEELDIPYDVREKESLGDYQLNCLSKPQFLLDTLNELDEPIVWMDIDSILHKSLDLFDELSEFDIAFASSNGLVSGAKASPIFLNNTDSAKEFLKHWINNTKMVLERKDKWFDHEVLFPLLNQFSHKSSNIQIAYLPPTYCVWPGNTNEDSAITMGLADNESKKDGLRKMGMEESLIDWQSTGNKFLDDEGKVKS
jgi:hypothetical protein